MVNEMMDDHIHKTFHIVLFYILVAVAMATLIIGALYVINVNILLFNLAY